MRVLRNCSHRRMAWKNGGGETVEIAVHPPGADLAGFDWRVSMATVAADGPFSAFPGIDRTLCLLEGEGMDLDIEGSGRHRLTVGSEPLRFPADAPTTAALLGGPIVDLNVMTRRGAASHAVEVRRVDDEAAFRPAARWTLLLPRAPLRAACEADAVMVELGAGDALLVEAGGPALRLRAEAAPVFVVTLEAAG